jgi:EmrB/QacA subfamily drug resistance transporter
MVILDVAVVNVAIPQMTDALSLSPAGQQWVIDAYTLTFGGLLLLGGRLADHYGQRRTFICGVLVFSIASLVCGLAQDQLTIELARGAQGAGGAAMAATSLSMVIVSFTDQRARAGAIAIWATVAASGGAAGVVLGGILTSAVSWRWVFFINVPVGALILFLTWTRISLAVSPRDRRLDIAGALLCCASLGLIIYAIIGVESRGWGSSVTLTLLGGGLLALLALVTVEASVATDPLLPLALFLDRGRAAANLLFVIIGAIVFFLYFDVSLHLQRVNGEGPLEAGLSFLPLSLATMVAALNGRRILSLLGVRRQLVLGNLLTVAGFFWIAHLGVRTDYWTHVGLPMIVAGIGIGLILGPATTAATTGVPDQHAGVASGLLNTSRQVGGAIGLAALTSIALAAGDRTALLCCTGLAVVGVFLSLFTEPRR